MRASEKGLGMFEAWSAEWKTRQEAARAGQPTNLQMR